jgi:pimeloyl-ACP methyl ester carboxylesterase
MMRVSLAAAVFLILFGCASSTAIGGKGTGRELSPMDFSYHSSVDGNAYLIFGNVPTPKPGPDLPADLAPFLGRWEGYDLGIPVKRDMEIVIAVREISEHGGVADLWSGTNLQYPSKVEEIEFSIRRDPALGPSIVGRPGFAAPYGLPVLSLAYDSATASLSGGLKKREAAPVARPIELTRGDDFLVYADYPAYLGEKGISYEKYANESLARFGNGYLVYLPERYGYDPSKTWPTILFLCGSGDKGDNPYLIAKASPYMFIREKGQLPFVILAPTLKASNSYRSFPREYLEGAVAEFLKTYLIDVKRLYVTGISMGGEAAFRLALLHPELVAAVAPVSAAMATYLKGYGAEAAETAKLPLSRLAGIPFLAIHGENDLVIRIDTARRTQADLSAAGADIELRVLPNHDHDAWTDTYSDPAFYDWLLGNVRR